MRRWRRDKYGQCVGSMNRVLPTNWAAARFSDLYGLLYGKGLIKKERNSNGQYPVYGSNGIVDYHDEYLVEGPVIIVGRKGAAGAVSFAADNCWPIDTTYYICKDEFIDLKFSFYLLASLRLNQYEKSTAIPGISRSDIYDLAIAVPPTNEQHRIVAKIEELFSELDKGIESLKTAREQLKVYRQAVLKHAFEGKLTAQWREVNKEKLEPTDQLLARIQKEREAHYQQQLEDWESAVKVWEEKSKHGKRPAKPRRQKSVPELENEELTDLSTIPDQWHWVKLGQLAWSVKDGPHYSPKYVDKGIPFISGGNIRSDGIDFETAKYISEDLHRELSVRCKPELGDILYTKGGTTGIACVNIYRSAQGAWND